MTEKEITDPKAFLTLQAKVLLLEQKIEEMEKPLEGWEVEEKCPRCSGMGGSNLTGNCEQCQGTGTIRRPLRNYPFEVKNIEPKYGGFYSLIIVPIIPFGGRIVKAREK